MTTPVYTDGVPIPDDGMVWRFRNHPVSARVGDTIYKRLDPWEGDEDLAMACARIWRREFETGWPSSPAKFFQQMWPRPDWYPASLDLGLWRHFYGGWQETFRVGEVPEPCGYYDLISAYLWSGIHRPLPEHFVPYKPGDEKFVGVMRVEDKPADLPLFLQGSDFLLVDHEDVDLWGLEGRMMDGVSWRDGWETMRAADLLGRCQQLLPPRAFKLLTRSYWGGWASGQPVTCEVREGGKVKKAWELPTRTRCIPLATLIVHAVVRKVWRKTREVDSVLVHTDAILSTDDIAVGEDPGDWELEELAPRGVEVLSPGVWDHRPADEDPGRWSRHSGIPTFAPTRQRKRAAAKLQALREQGYKLDGPEDYRELMELSDLPLSRLDLRPDGGRVREIMAGIERVQGPDRSLDELDSALGWSIRSLEV